MRKLKGLSSLALVTLLFSFVGWLFEVLLFRLAYGNWYDRGFLTLPFCPIYGFTLLLIYLLLGTPLRGGLLFNRIEKGRVRIFIFFIFSAIIATISELVVGWTVEHFCGRVLWDYSGYALALGRYACIEVSIIWGVLISFTTIVFHKLYILINNLQLWLITSLAVVSWGSILIDFVLNFINR